MTSNATVDSKGFVIRRSRGQYKVCRLFSDRCLAALQPGCIVLDRMRRVRTAMGRYESSRHTRPRLHLFESPYSGTVFYL